MQDPYQSRNSAIPVRKIRPAEPGFGGLLIRSWTFSVYNNNPENGEVPGPISAAGKTIDLWGGVDERKTDKLVIVAGKKRI